MAGGAITILAFTPANGFLNAGVSPALLLAVGGCPDPPVMAGEILTLDSGGTICLGGLNVTVDCGPNGIHANAWVGLVSTPPGSRSGVCSGGTCTPVSTDPQNWGAIKALYR